MKKAFYIVILSFLVSCSGNYVVRMETPSQWYDRNLKEVEQENKVDKTKDLPNVSDKLNEIKQGKDEIGKKIVNLKQTEAYGKDNFFNGNATEPKEEEAIKTDTIPVEHSNIIINSPDIPKNIPVTVSNSVQNNVNSSNVPVKPVEVVKVVEVVKPVEVYVPTIDNTSTNNTTTNSNNVVNTNVISNSNTNSNNVESKPIQTVPQVVESVKPNRNYNVAEQKLIKYISDKVLENQDQVEDLIEKYYAKINNKISREIFIALCAKYIRDQKVNNFAYGVNQVVSEIESDK